MKNNRQKLNKKRKSEFHLHETKGHKKVSKKRSKTILVRGPNGEPIPMHPGYLKIQGLLARVQLNMMGRL